MDVLAQGRIRKPLEGIDASAVGDIEEMVLTQQLEVLVAAGKAPYTEICRLGRAFQVTNTTAVAAAVAIPTTTAGLQLYNGEPDGGRSYVIDFISASNVVSAATAAQASLVCIVGQVREAVPTNSALVAKKLNGLGGGTNDTKARTVLTGTTLPATTGIAADWIPVGPSAAKPGVAATPGYSLYYEPNGRIIVPPGRFFAVQVIANVVGETFVHCIAWHELQLTLG
jgi:hypothetical protein